MAVRPRRQPICRILTDFFSKRRLTLSQSVPPFLQVVTWSPVADMTAATTKRVLSHLVPPVLHHVHYFRVGLSESILVCAEPKTYRHVAQLSPFSKEACVCRDDRDPVLFHSRRAGILPVCPAPDYLRQEGGCHGTQI